MKCALVYTEKAFYDDRSIPILIDYTNGDRILDFTDGRLVQSILATWLKDGEVIFKKVVADTRLNRTLYPEAKELDGYLILDEDLKAEDFWGSK